MRDLSCVLWRTVRVCKKPFWCGGRTIPPWAQVLQPARAIADKKVTFVKLFCTWWTFLCEFNILRWRVLAWSVFLLTGDSGSARCFNVYARTGWLYAVSASLKTLYFFSSRFWCWVGKVIWMNGYTLIDCRPFFQKKIEKVNFFRSVREKWKVVRPLTLFQKFLI